MSLRMAVMQRVAVAATTRLSRREPEVELSRRPTAAMERRFRVAPGVREHEDIVAGVPVRRYSSGARTRGVVLHVHGGAYISGSSRMGRRYSLVASDGGPDVVSVDYRLAPEHPHPAALDDAYAVYAALCDEPIVVMGESAGGGLALSLVQRVHAEGRLPMPVGVAALFPWADLTQSSPRYAANLGRDILTKDGLDWSAGLYAGEHDVRQPGISPAFGSFEGFPKTLIVVGSADCLLDDARGAADALRAAGVAVELREIPKAIHGFLVLPTPEARAELRHLAAFVKTSVADASPPIG